MTTLASATIDAEDTYTDPVLLEGYFNISISGTFDATVTVQRSIDNVNWVDVEGYTDPYEGVGFDPEFIYYRIGVKAGDYTSGDAVVRIGREDKDRH